VDGDVPVTITGTVNTNTADSYTIIYSATDSSNNTGTATRTVNVVVPQADTTPPVITLNGDNPLTLSQGETFLEPGTTATDNVDGNVPVTVTGTVDTNTADSYIITYSATDSSNNTGTATRTVNVVAPQPDTTPPVITLNGDNPMTVIQGATYIEPGATATDDMDGSVPVTITGTVDTNTADSYTITYSATDTAGNTGTTTRTVNIVAPQADTTPPVISLNGDNPMTVIVGNTYVEPGATATDDVDGDVSVTITGTVDTNTADSYTLTYSATDNAGNPAIATRTVNVVNSIQRPFITTWKTDNEGVSDINQVKITTAGGGYNYTIDWGDGQVDTNVGGDITHTYDTVGTYTVKISGDFPRIFLRRHAIVLLPILSDAYKLLSIEQWGSIKWLSMSRAFQHCINVTSNAVDVPDLSLVTDMSYMFSGAKKFNQDIGGWDVSTITNMSHLFDGASEFNQDLSLWNVSKVTDMSYMFDSASKFNQNIGDWNVSAVTNMSNMFSGAVEFNQDIGGWNVAAVTDMSKMFSAAVRFNQNISDWNVSAVTNMYNMFWTAVNFNIDIGAWNVSKVTDMSGMFGLARSFNGNIVNWNVSEVTRMPSMFHGATAFNRNIGNWDVSKVTSMSLMFASATEPMVFNQNIGNWDVSAVLSMDGMFSSLSNLSTANYDALLLGWSVQNLQAGVIFSAGNTQYSNSLDVLAARAILTDTVTGYSWTITDGGVVQ
jgi:surface protein